MRARLLVLLLGAALLSAAAALRGTEYDEAYSLFLLAGTPRPAWPTAPFRAGAIRNVLAGHAGLPTIARALRRTDVHPPLYFWSLALWRRVVGGGLFGLRLFSVGCALAALALVGAIARRVGVPPAAAMAFTLGCYGFVYTGAIARDFALAEALVLGGVWLALGARGRPAARAAAAGFVLGAACFANYLAAFQAAAVGLWLLSGRGGAASREPPDEVSAPASRATIVALTRRGPAIACLAGLLAWLPAGLWFFLAQRDSRAGQFPPFRWLPSLRLLARDGAGAVFGGRPLYLPGAGRVLAGGALALLLAALAGLVLARWRLVAAGPARALLGLAALAPPVGLLALGLVFDSTPIELRYLAFATPFLGLLLAGALGSLPRRAGRAIGAGVACVQALALAGLLLGGETMQPARATAAAAARLAGRSGLVVLSRGNDGVGAVGPFLIEAPPWLHVLVADRAARAAVLRRVAGRYPRVVVAELSVDAASRAARRRLRAAFAGPGFREAPESWAGAGPSRPELRLFTPVTPRQAPGGPATISAAR